MSFRKADVDSVPQRTPVGRERKMAIRGSDPSFSRGQDQNFNPGTLSITPQSNATYSTNNTSSWQTQSQRISANQIGFQPQTHSVSNLMERQQTSRTPSADYVDGSRRGMENLAEENAQLKLELENLRNQKEDAQDAMDRMLSDLMIAQSELQERDAAINRQQGIINEQNIQLEYLQKNGGTSTKMEQTISMLRIEIRERDRISREREESWNAELQNQRAKAATELHKLQAAVHQQEDSRRAADVSQAEAERSRAEQYLQELQQLKTTYAAILPQVEAERAKAEQYHQELQRLRAELSEKDNSQALENLKALHAAELGELRRISNFFKNNSERLSKQTKEMMAEHRTLKETVEMKDREVQEQASIIYALELQMGES